MTVVAMMVAMSMMGATEMVAVMVAVIWVMKVTVVVVMAVANGATAAGWW